MEPSKIKTFQYTWFDFYQIVKAECMEITVVYLVVIASDQNNATLVMERV